MKYTTYSSSEDTAYITGDQIMHRDQTYEKITLQREWKQHTLFRKHQK